MNCLTVFLFLIFSFELIASSKIKSFIQYPLSAGVGLNVKSLISEYQKRKFSNVALIFIHHPNQFINFKKPHQIAGKLIKNGKFETNFGHMQLAWSCNIKGKIFESSLGYTGDSAQKMIKMIKSGFGLTPFITKFKDGKIEGPLEVERRVAHSINSNSLTIIGVNLKNNCQSLLSEIWKFINGNNSFLFSMASLNHSKDTSRNCTSSIISWFKSINKINDFLTKKSLVSMNVPKKLFGNKESKVSILDMINNWNGAYVKAIMFDPGTLILNLNSKFKKFSNSTYLNKKTLTIYDLTEL